MRDLVFSRLKRTSEPHYDGPTWDEEGTILDPYCVSYVDGVGRGDVWPYYWRALMIAAYRRNAALDNERECGGFQQQRLDAILGACPPNHDAIRNNDWVECGYYHRDKHPYERSSSLRRHNQVDEWFMFREDGAPQLWLDAAGVYPIVELAMLHWKAPVTTPLIRRTSTMMETLRPFIAYNDEDKTVLDGTPYAGVDDAYNYADRRTEEVVDAFREAARHEFVVAHFQ